MSETTTGTFVRSEFFLVIEAHMELWCGKNPSLIIPVQIRALPPEPPLVPAPPDWQPQVMDLMILTFGENHHLNYNLDQDNFNNNMAYMPPIILQVSNNTN